MMQSIIILIISTIAPLLLLGQKKEYIIEVAPFIGSSFVLTQAVAYDFTSFGFDAKHINQSTNDKNWQQYYNLPRTGKELLFSQYSLNGYSIALNTFIEFDILRSSKHNLFVSPGLGLAYTSETSSSLPDYRLTSLPINISVKLEFGYRYAITPHWKIGASYFLNHLSNGNISSPNDGLNMKAWKLNIAYSYGEEFSPNYSSYKKPTYNKIFGQVSLGSGVKSSGEEQYGFLNSFLNGGISFHPFHRLVAGVGIFTDRPFSEKLQTTQLGFSLGYQIIIGKVNFSFQPGWYSEKYNGEWRYYMITLQYPLHPHLFLQTNLRTTKNFFSEDLAIGLGVEF